MITKITFAARARAATVILVALLLLATPATVGAQAKSRVRRTAGRAKVTRPYPGFGSYPASASFTGTPTPVVLRTRRDQMFRSRLREGAKEGPNFAGRYTAVHWGCGTGCAQMAVVDAKTGRVYRPPLEYVDIPAADGEEYGPGYRLDSRLLVLTRSHYDREASYTAYYYVFEHNHFRLVRRAERKGRPIETEDPPGNDPLHDNHH